MRSVKWDSVYRILRISARREHVLLRVELDGVRGGDSEVRWSLQPEVCIQLALQAGEDCVGARGESEGDRRVMTVARWICAKRQLAGYCGWQDGSPKVMNKLVRKSRASSPGS